MVCGATILAYEFNGPLATQNEQPATSIAQNPVKPRRLADESLTNNRREPASRISTPEKMAVLV
jgi:hypothetical protein